MGKRKEPDDAAPCACGSGIAASGCCAPFLAGRALPLTAEALMRSRYCAFAQRDADYLLDSWHPRRRPRRLRFNPGQRWLGLKILSRQAGGPGHTQGTVEFVARYKVAGRGRRHHELSRFERLEGRWVYVDGEDREPS